MKIYYDDYRRPEPSKVYLGTPTHQVLCVLNGINAESFSYKKNLNNISEISFDVDRFIVDDEGNQIESNGYNWLQLYMRLYLEGVGWFICSPPSVTNDGIKETKNILASSCEAEMMQHDIKGLKINRGTTDSYEMLVENNVTIDDYGVEFAKESIVFYNKENPELSLLNILLKVSNLHGWTIGHIDNIPKEYKKYKDGQLETELIALADEKGSFEIDVQDLYSFLTQTVAQYFGCVFIFDNNTMTINAYRPENLGKNTNINIGFRNIQNSNSVTIDENNIFTVYNVSGSDDLGITHVNGGTNTIVNLDYFLNEKYLSADVINKYKMWTSDLEKYRPEYIENTRLYNAQLDVISELYNRLPLDDCSTDWATFEDGALLEAKSNYEAQLKGYESFYVDENGEFDEEALKNSEDANDYYQIKDVILPSIQIEIDNRKLDPSEDPEEYINSFETNWDLYGLDELQAKLDAYKNTIEVAKSGGYIEPYSSDSGHTVDYHEAMYAKYVDAKNQLNANYEGSCQEAYNTRKKEIDDAESILEEYNKSRKHFAMLMDMETWIYSEEYSDIVLEDNTLIFPEDPNLNSNGELEIDGYTVINGILINDNFRFTEKDLAELSKLFIDNTYSNEHMFLTSSDTAVTAIDEQLKLLDAAKEDLSIVSQPQFTYATDLDNFLALYDYKDYTSVLNLGDFIWLGVRDDYVVKLRIISMSYNPLLMDNNLQIEFSNMVASKAKRDDFTYLLGNAGGRGKNSSSGSGGDYVTNEGIGLTAGLISKLVANGSFKNTVNQWIEEGMAVSGSSIIAGTGGSGGEITVEQLNAKMIEVIDIVGENAFFEYLQAKLISADKIVAESGSFDELDALVAKIDSLLAGTISAEDFHALKLTVDNAVIDDAVIKDLIAAKISVSMLSAGSIDTNKFNIKSTDGGLEIVGNTMQFTDSQGNIRIQIGRDENQDFTFTLYNADGSGVLIDDTGIHESAITDGLIKNEMIAEGTIEKDKLGFPIVETDANGKVSITEILDPNGESLGVSYTEMQTTVSELGKKVENAASYTVVLGNEYQNIPCINGLSKESMTIEIPYGGYIGANRAEAIATIGSLPNGVLLGSITKSTTESDGIITLIISKDADFGGISVLTGYIPIVFTINNIEITKRFTWSKTNDGDSSTAKVYSLEPSTNIIVRSVTEEGTLLSPSKITFSAFLKEGEARSDYSGRFIIQTSQDGATYSNNYLSVNDESSIIFVPEVNVRNIKCFLYKSGGITNLIETCTVSILDDDSQTRAEITEISETVTQLSSTVDKTEKAITDEVWRESIITTVDENGQEISKTLNSLLVQHQVDLNGISSTVKEIESDYYDEDGQSLSEKVSTIIQTVDEITTSVEAKIDAISTSSRNLLMNSKTLVFDNYGLLSSNIATVDSQGLLNVALSSTTSESGIIDYSDDPSVDEDGLLIF